MRATHKSKDALVPLRLAEPSFPRDEHASALWEMFIHAGEGETLPPTCGGMGQR